MIRVLLTLALLLPAFTAQANDGASSHRSKYAGLANRAIKSLSAEDIAELKRGGGWGLGQGGGTERPPGTHPSAGDEG